MKPIIGLVGYKRAGKDTVCSMLSLRDKRIRRFALADALKEEVCAAFSVTLDELEDNKVLWRPLLQWWGTEFRQKIQDNQMYWVRKLLSKVEQSPSGTIAVVTDVRFPHEVAVIRELGGVLAKVFVERENLDPHASESHIDNIQCDSTIFNIGTKDELLTHVNNFYETFVVPRYGRDALPS